MGAGGDQVIAGVTFAAPLAPDIPEQEMRKDVAGSSAAMVISTNGPDSLRRMAVSSDNETLASLGCSTGERGCRAGLSFSGEPHKEQTAPFFGIRPQPVNRYWEIARRISGGPLIAPIVNAAQALDAELHDVHIAEPSLETLFLHHTGRSLRD